MYHFRILACRVLLFGLTADRTPGRIASARIRWAFGTVHP